MAEDRIGQQLGNYRLLQRLGEGGFAEVYLGEHIYLTTQAAIKILHTRLGADDLDTFVSEARTIARLKHPHIVRVLEFGVEGSIPFLVMDYAPNGTLRQRHRKGARLEPALIVPYVKQVAEALHYAHEQKLVHRDVKPENMLIGERDEVLLSDFGIATVAQSSRYQGTQEVAGTVAYMAPEQVQGKPRPASDQYSLGVVIYEWLTGERPFHGSFTEIATQHVLMPPPPLREKRPELAREIEEVVLTALAKDPKERFATVQAFATAFEQACQGAALHFAPTHIIAPSGSVARPTHVVPAAAPEINGVTSIPHLPPTVAVPPSHSPARPGTADYASLPPGWHNVSVPAPTMPPTMRDTTSSPLRSAADVSALPPKEPEHPQRRSARRQVVVGSLVILLILVIAGGTWTAIYNPFTFHQDVTTGPHITGIQAGTLIDSTETIQGGGDTFTVGDTIYVLLTVSGVGEGASFEVTLLQNGNTVYRDPIFVGVNPQSSYMDHTIVTSPGTYKWEVSYNGTPEASITFQVVS